MTDVDMSKFIISKSDQQNAEDFLGGPRTIKITTIRGTDDADQPVAIGFEGDDGKPFKPSKTVRRILVHAWGLDGKTYVGRSLTLYRDENVMFGGIRVGGIRVSHMSHIDREMTVALSFTRGKKAVHTIKPLKTQDTSQVDRGVTRKPAETSPEPPDLPNELPGIEMITASDDQVAAWCEMFKAIGLKQKTASGLIQQWKSYHEGQIKPLFERNRAAYDVLEAWVETRVKKLRTQEKSSS